MTPSEMTEDFENSEMLLYLQCLFHNLKSLIQIFFMHIFYLSKHRAKLGHGLLSGDYSREPVKDSTISVSHLYKEMLKLIKHEFGM